MDRIDTEQRRERIKSRCVDLSSSTWWTYNQHYKAANFNKFLGRGFSILIAVLGGILSYGLIWDEITNWLMVILAVSVSVISGIQLALSPSDERERLAESAHQYQVLFDDVVEFLELEILRDDKTVDDIYTEYQELQQRRKELNKESPDVSSFWYHYIKAIKGSEGMKEAFSSDSEKDIFDEQ